MQALKDSFETKYDLDIPLGQVSFCSLLQIKGMHASVFKCFRKDDSERTRPFAVKVMREDDEEKIMASKKEFEITQKLKHENIVKSFEMFVNDQKKEVHQVMEFIDGQEVLDQIAELGAYGEKEAQHIFG